MYSEILKYMLSYYSKVYFEISNVGALSHDRIYDRIKIEYCKWKHIDLNTLCSQ